MANQSIARFALKFTLAVCALGCIAAPARADLISDIVYHLSVCGGDSPATPGSACFVQSATIAPPAGSTDGLGVAVLRQFLESQGAQVDSLDYSITGANHAGVVFGGMVGETLIDGQFVYRSGAVLCCFIDAPYNLVGLNDGGLFIGNDGEGASFVSSELDSFSVHQDRPTLDAASAPFFESVVFSRFTAIDNDNRISGFGSLGAFILTPVDLLAVPEPSSLVLLAGALALFLRRVRWTAAPPALCRRFQRRAA